MKTITIDAPSWEGETGAPPRLTQVKEAAERAVNKTWHRVKAIWDATPAAIRWTIGFTAFFAGCFLYGYVVASIISALLLALGVGATTTYVLTMALTLGSFYGILFAALAARGD